MTEGGLPTGLWVIIVAALVIVLGMAGLIVALTLLGLF